MTLKEKLLSEALRQFSSRGYSATSTGSIIVAAGASKGGLYNHFRNKEELFLQTLSLARKIWREKNLIGLENIERPLDKIVQLLKNYRDNYLTASDALPGGCIFVNIAVELSDDFPHLGREIHEGFVRLKNMLQRLLEEERAMGSLLAGVDTAEAAEIIFSGILGACVVFSADKSWDSLNRTINALCHFTESMKI